VLLYYRLLYHVYAVITRWYIRWVH